jgi:glycoprotein-N-acetylgalactosamine 3-beta-galactosyltransferase
MKIKVLHRLECMKNLGVETNNSSDALGRSRFHCSNPETHLFGKYPEWYYRYDANGAKKVLDLYLDMHDQTYYSNDY